MADTSHDRAKAQIRDAGLRATAPRIAVLELLESSSKPLSHTEVVNELCSDVWDQATLYRNLLKLTEVGLARAVSKVDGIVRYQACGDDDGLHLHPHFSCKSCGTVECLPEAKLKLSAKVTRRWSRSLVAAEMQLVGDCPSCLQGT